MMGDNFITKSSSALFLVLEKPHSTKPLLYKTNPRYISWRYFTESYVRLFVIFILAVVAPYLLCKLNFLHIMALRHG